MFYVYSVLNDRYKNQILNIQVLHKLIDIEKEKKKENRRILRKKIL